MEPEVAEAGEGKISKSELKRRQKAAEKEAKAAEKEAAKVCARCRLRHQHHAGARYHPLGDVVFALSFAFL